MYGINFWPLVRIYLPAKSGLVSCSNENSLFFMHPSMFPTIFKIRFDLSNLFEKSYLRNFLLLVMLEQRLGHINLGVVSSGASSGVGVFR
ncbi:hypothetical protein AtNW77_Chr2g0232631 [Arabidopsis thaliana]|uniref:Uncharacterized protein n=5 Tax=Arabidopsis TaxID=3701 RepID=A0A178VU67_ARATH|nr:uncharacterized protein AT2G15318 [Arabidopsis thaliana]KAG7636258.1 hypothetical protein ISN45_At02g008980 [Arabidopsis thaliana x Arabidopsis arenosa]KAG7640878.1 hypothetical protein ISN44_As02g009160 [Arabidopsis suecica]ABF59349.1 unknown protein [Arabidopsis thaliana]AEC06386.1 hypothetical protein AT2G15318 [Arabidopsis thaliana]OAP09358.1 hypothetical protein AXX17_AT2G10500 [Arabidopsis thaliana]|eukprot:NP_001318228.1 hypothetical protein AT2G15318 [Arabidopsis thaliana]